jgi:hypothetical protein
LQGIQTSTSKQMQPQTVRRKSGEGVLFQSDANHAFLGILRRCRGIGELMQDKEWIPCLFVCGISVYSFHNSERARLSIRLIAKSRYQWKQGSHQFVAE